jgi:NADH-quinone oxidoreductase subunit C
MSTVIENLAQSVSSRFGEALVRVASRTRELTFEVPSAALVETCRVLRDDPALRFEQLVDLCGVDYLDYGRDEWTTESATRRGFSRGVAPREPGATATATATTGERRFAAVYHLLSVTHNVRLRLRAFCEAGEPPMLDSVVEIWRSADWFEREAFDLFGILFRGHPDLRRLLTDYGFIGHPFRKDFPLIGNVEVIYDPEKGRVVYQPVTVEPRTLVPRVIREDNRYAAELKGGPRDG